MNQPITPAQTRAALLAAQEGAAWHAVPALNRAAELPARLDGAVLLIDSPAQLRAFAHCLVPGCPATVFGVAAARITYSACRPEEACALAELGSVPVTVAGHDHKYLPPDRPQAGPLDFLRRGVLFARLGMLGLEPLDQLPPPAPERYERTVEPMRALTPPAPPADAAEAVPAAPIKRATHYDSTRSPARALRVAQGVTETDRRAWLATALAYFDDPQACPHGRSDSDRDVLKQYLRYFEDTSAVRAVRAELETNKGFPPPTEIWLDLADVLDYMATPRSLDTPAFRAEHGMNLREHMIQTQVHAMGVFSMWYGILEGEWPADHDAGAWLRGGTSG